MTPAIVKHVVYPTHERICGRRTFRYLEELERTQHLSRAEIEGYQRARLKALLQVARRHSPWHRDRLENAGIDVDDPGELTLEALRQLPTMDKHDASAHRADIVWKDVPGGAHRYTTGGSSGEPLVFYFGKRRQESDAAGRMRARRWWGVDVGDKEVYVWGAPVELTKSHKLRTFRDRVVNHLVLNAFNMTATTMTDYVKQIVDYRAKCIYGYASSLALLASHILDSSGHKPAFPKLKVVCTTGEPLYPHQRELISDAFGVPVANEFGSRDIGFTAHESPAGQMLLLSESHILEILEPDGTPVASGQAGEAVITGLCSDAQPFIRYRTGDVIIQADELCRHGLGLHVLGEVSGRQTDMVVAPDGTIMHALAIIYVFREFNSVQKFKFIQHSPNEFEVIVVPQSDWTEKDAESIKDALRARLGETIAISLTIDTDIPLESSGKHRQVVSHVPVPGGLTYL